MYYVISISIYPSIIYLSIYLSIYDSQILHHNPGFNLFVLHNNSFDNQGSKINKNDVFILFVILSFTKLSSNSFFLSIHKKATNNTKVFLHILVNVFSCALT